MATTRKTRSTGSARRSATQSAAQRIRSAKAKGSTTGRRSATGSTPDRDSHGRFKADHHVRNAAVGTAAAIGAVAAGVAAAFRFGLLDRFLPAREGHAAEDLLIEHDGGRPGPGDRAAEAFRPDMDAPMTKAEKEALRLAKGQRAADLAGADTGAIETV